MPPSDKRSGEVILVRPISQHFTWEEAAQKARPDEGFPLPVDVPLALMDNAKRCAELLEAIRAIWEKPIRILSWYRSPSYNALVGGEKNSQHMNAAAADIQVAGVLPLEVHDTILDFYKIGKLPLLGGLGCYRSFTHVDVRRGDHLARWAGYRIAAEITRR